jgi:Holliday junction resolvase
MSSPSKIKGNTFEREVVNQAKEFGLKSIRAYASNGKSLGEAEDVDVKIEWLLGQCKRRKRIAQWLKPPESCDIALVREDRGETYVIIEYGNFLEMLSYMKELRNNTTKKASMFDDK